MANTRFEQNVRVFAFGSDTRPLPTPAKSGRWHLTMSDATTFDAAILLDAVHYPPKSCSRSSEILFTVRRNQRSRWAEIRTPTTIMTYQRSSLILRKDDKRKNVKMFA